jgi:hypothetical protein
MMQIRKILVVAAALALQTLLVQAENVTRKVGDTEFNFAVPREFCVLEESNARDAIFINVVRTLLRGASNKLILLTVNCKRLKTWREGVAGNILRYAMYYIPDNLENSTLPGDNKKLRNELCQDMRKQGDATLAGVKDIVANAARELNANIAVNSTKYVGVVDEDDNGCYAALLIGVKGGDGKNILMSSIVTSTVIHGKPLFFAMYNQYDGPDTAKEDVDRSRIVAADFDRSNP